MFEGVLVTHKKFGNGNVLSINDNNITVDFDNAGRKTLSLLVSIEKGILTTTDDTLLSFIYRYLDVKETERLFREEQERREAELKEIAIQKKREAEADRLAEIERKKSDKSRFTVDLTGDSLIDLCTLFPYGREKDIQFDDIHDMFYCIGWIARNVQCTNAEISYTREADFNSVFGVKAKRNLTITDKNSPTSTGGGMN